MKKPQSGVLPVPDRWLSAPSLLLTGEVVLCMFGKVTGNSGGSECSSAEKPFQH